MQATLIGETVSVRMAKDAANPRAWRCQLLARTAERMPKVMSRASDYEPLEDAVVVYLRNGELVELE